MYRVRQRNYPQGAPLDHKKRDKKVNQILGHSYIVIFQKKYFMSFLPHYCHSFRITVIPSGLLSFLPDYCHSFQIGVIPSKYCHSFRIIQKITNTNQLQKLPIPEGREKWPPEVAIYASSRIKTGLLKRSQKYDLVMLRLFG